jgi:two-component system, NarL family, response regulator DevR
VNVRDELTKQEKNVLALIAQGWRTAKIAQELFISPRTVETHLSHIFEKLGVSSRTEAALYALQAKLAVNLEIRRNPEDTLNNNFYS